METARLSFVLLVIAMANLATDITRLVLELARPPPLHESAPVKTRPSQQVTSSQPPDAREPGTAQKDLAEKKAKPLDAPTARGPPREPREAGTAGEPFRQLPPDFSVKHPPWCLACRQPMHRYLERGRFQW
jgi:hypothetical protein